MGCAHVNPGGCRFRHPETGGRSRLRVEGVHPAATTLPTQAEILSLERLWGHRPPVSFRGSSGEPVIGELNERSLHRALKARYAGAHGATEQSVDGFVVDVIAGGRIIEIHTSGFGPLQHKLARLAERHPVTLVYPVARDRYIVKTAADPDTPAKRRKSPRHGSVYDVFHALAGIPAMLAHPNITLDVVMTVEDEVRAPDGRTGWRRRGWSRRDRRLLDVVEICTITSMADLFDLLDADLPEPFTTMDLASAMKSTRRLGQLAAYCFREAGVTEVCGKNGNTRVYRRAAR